MMRQFVNAIHGLTRETQFSQNSKCHNPGVGPIMILQRKFYAMLFFQAF